MRIDGYFPYSRHLMDVHLRLGAPASSFVLVVGLVLAGVMTGGTDGAASMSAVSAAGRNSSPCHTSTPDKWSGCLPGANGRIA
jgi:hypothetical protein